MIIKIKNQKIKKLKLNKLKKNGEDLQKPINKIKIIIN